MNTYYFTYGSEGHPYFGGWTEIVAPNIIMAEKIFDLFHPPKENGIHNCGSIYFKFEFEKTKMFTKGNFGYFCHERITVNWELLDSVESNLSNKKDTNEKVNNNDEIWLH